MDVITLVFLSIVSFLCGVILTLVIQSYIFLKCFNKRPVVVPSRKPCSETCSLPETLKEKLNTDGSNAENASLAISLMLQFLFHELKHSDTIKRWLYKKLSLEFEELITKTTTGKFFDSVTIRDMHLGSEAPILKTVGVEQVKLDKTEDYIDILNICTKVVYSGNFMLSVDAKMKFGKTAYLSINVKRVSGLARLQFTRLPYTHWSFSFYNEPDIELVVESHFQGRQLQANVTNLIMNQIKKAIKRKHTLPNYKIRYKPFFVKADPGQIDSDDTEIVTQGQLELMCVEVSRLATSAEILQVYCIFASDSIPWICVYRRDGLTCMVLDLTISKTRQQALGATFKQDQTFVIVDFVSSHSPSEMAGLKSGDTLIAIDSKGVSNVTQATKLFKLVSSGSFSVRIERIVNNYVWKSKFSDVIEEKTSTVIANTPPDVDISQAEQDSFVIVDPVKSKPEHTPELSKRSKSITNIEKFKGSEKIPKFISGSNDNVSKLAHTIGNFTLRKRKSSIERSSSDTTNRSTPTPSTPSTPQHSIKQHTVSVPSILMLSSKKSSIVELPEGAKSDNAKENTKNVENVVEMYKGQMKDLGAIVAFNDEYMFNLKECEKYLNVNIWGITPANKEVLLGYLNIPLSQVLNECCNSVVGHYIKKYSLLPPTNVVPTSQSHPLMTHSGFEHVFCYGDVLLSFMWSNDGSSEIQRKERINSFTEGLPQTIGATSDRHDFMRTQFHRTVYCDFCTKKIWLKDAVTCRICELKCHKKCVSKCLISTPCNPEKGSTQSDTQELSQPEITTTEVDDDLESESMIIVPGMKRVNSVNSLSIPGSHSPHGQSKSLPPSPQRTPRKLSLVASNPFTVCPNALDELYQQSSDASTLIQSLVEEMLQYPPDEALMDAAKESGIHMYNNIPHQLKMGKINLMVTELKRTLDSITIERMEMSKKSGATENEVEKAKLAFLIGQADAKIHALTVLMLHYCSGLQHSQDKIV